MAHFRCTGGGKKHGSYCYILSKDIKPWADAHQKCHKMDGSLAIIKDEETSLFITNLIRSSRHVSIYFRNIIYLKFNETKINLRQNFWVF